MSKTIAATILIVAWSLGFGNRLMLQSEAVRSNTILSLPRLLVYNLSDGYILTFWLLPISLALTVKIVHNIGQTQSIYRFGSKWNWFKASLVSTSAYCTKIILLTCLGFTLAGTGLPLTNSALPNIGSAQGSLLQQIFLLENQSPNLYRIVVFLLLSISLTISTTAMIILAASLWLPNKKPLALLAAGLCIWFIVAHNTSEIPKVFNLSLAAIPLDNKTDIFISLLWLAVISGLVKIVTHRQERYKTQGFQIWQSWAWPSTVIGLTALTTAQVYMYSKQSPQDSAQELFSGIFAGISSNGFSLQTFGFYLLLTLLPLSHFLLSLSDTTGRFEQYLRIRAGSTLGILSKELLQLVKWYSILAISTGLAFWLCAILLKTPGITTDSYASFTDWAFFWGIGCVQLLFFSIGASICVWAGLNPALTFSFAAFSLCLSAFPITNKAFFPLSTNSLSLPKSDWQYNALCISGWLIILSIALIVLLRYRPLSVKALKS